MWIGVISLFPDMFRAVTDYGIVGRAVRKGLLSIKFWNPREFANDIHRSVDDYLYGGGPGMLMMAQPLKDAISCAKREVGSNVKVVYLSPQGRIFNQDRVNELLMDSKLILVCGRYKGVDERIIVEEIDEEWSIGDYILSGGELAAMVLIDTVSRFIPGVLGRIESAMDDTFSNNKKLAILAPPHYTRPAVFNGISVPNILLSGNHSEINKWRLKKSLERTWFRRPELLKNVVFSDEEKQLLLEFKHEILNQLSSE